jgi:6,7-dimethyl-8-ribityllumazine synthase
VNDRKPVLVVVAADFNKEVVDAMIAAAWAEATRCQLSDGGTIRVPGCYEIPLAASRTLRRSGCDLLVALGYIEAGETLHGTIMGQVVSQSLVELSLETDKPIGLGIIGPGATLEQAMVRRESYARAAVRAAYANLVTGSEFP